MRSLLFVLLISCSVGVWAQNSSSSKSQPPDAPAPSAPTPDTKSSPDTKPAATNPNLAPPRSDRINASSLPDEGESSSKDAPVDLSPPDENSKVHSKDDVLVDEGSGSGNGVHPWDPHKAAKDIEVGDFYFKLKNYIAAESRYREALFYKDNDALATFRLAECLEKMDRLDEARQEYESYLRILPNGPQAEKANKAIAKLNKTTAKVKPAK